MNMTATPIPKSSDADLLARISRGDEKAFSTIIDRYAGLVEGAARVSGLDASEVPDVVQAAFIVLWNQRKSAPAASKLGNWLHGVAKNLALRHIRSNSRTRQREKNWHQQQMETHTQSDTVAGGALLAPEARLALHHSLDKLGSGQRQILIARFWEKKPFGLIGRELGCSEDAAKKRFTTAIRKLRGLLAAAGLTSISSAAVQDLLDAEVAAPAGCASAAHGSLHSASAAARTLAGMWKPGPPLATLGLIAGGVAAVAIACVVVMQLADGEPPAATVGTEAAAAETRPARISSARFARPAAAPLSEWTFGEPTVLLECPADTPGKGYVWHLPLPIAWLNGVPMIPVISGMKTDSNTFHIFAPTGGQWKQVVTIEGLHFPKMLALSNGTLGIVGHDGKDPSGGYGAALYYYSYDPNTGVSEPWVLATPPNEQARITMVGLQQLPDQQLVAIMLLHSSGHSLLEARSTDGGKTWSEPVERLKTNMSEDAASVMGVVPLGDAGLGVFNLERNKPLEMLVVPPDGGEWQARPVTFTDDLPDTVKRMPLKVVADGSGVALAYLAMGTGDGAGSASPGTYHLVQSADAGASWSPGKSIATVDEVEDHSMIFGLSASGNRLIANYLDGTKRKFHPAWKGSDDGGITWFDLSGASEEALLGEASLSPSGNRAYAAEVVAGAYGSEIFQVREIRPADR